MPKRVVVTMSIIKTCAILLALQLARCDDSIVEDVNKERDLNNPNARIVGGNIVQNRTNFAYQAAVLLDNVLRCGASIIDHRNLLTAAHCVTDRDGNALVISRLKAVIGELVIEGNVSGLAVAKDIRDIIVHEQFNPNNNMNNIALLRIDPLTFNANVTSIPIARWSPPPLINCVVSGWGATSIGGIPSRSLQYVTVQIKEPAVCRTYFNPFLQGMLCAGNVSSDACLGDEGGPLVCQGAQVGIVSMALGCGDHPSVYTSIPNFFTWIQIQQESSSSRVPIWKYSVILSIIVHLSLVKII